MHISEIYKSIYAFYADTTPLTVDCGKLCGGACCESDDNEETGMYLFPGEEKLFINNPDFKIIDSEFSYGDEFAKILICKGVCKREIRPLSCRIFPIIPYLKGDDFTLIFDPRAKSVCPLVELSDINELDEVFIKKTKKVIKLLMKFKKTRAFLEALCDILDDYLKFGV
jgi:Fe-S-cluster containining protein